MSKRSFRLVSEDILKETLRKKQLLEKYPGYHLHYSNGKKKALRKEANKHSVSLELEIYDTSTPEGRKKKIREQKKCGQNLYNAMNWGMEHYRGEPTDDFIKHMGYLIEPGKNVGGYRGENVRITGASWSPPSAEKVQREMSAFLLENISLDNVIEKAVHSHFHIARIHPFIDGNGRTARGVQNVMLEYSGFFPIIIKPSERVEYVHLLDCAVNSYRIVEGTLPPQHHDMLNELYTLVENPPLSNHEEERRKALILEVMKARMTAEQNDFYNFMALQTRDILREAGERLYKLSRQRKK